MRLWMARIQKYRSIRDTGWFEVEPDKTILVGPNEAGKTAILQALQQINPPPGTRGFHPLRDYPRSEYNDISTKRVRPEDIAVVQAKFVLDPEDKEVLPEGFKDVTYVAIKKLDNSYWHRIEGGPAPKKYGDVRRDLGRLTSYVDSRVPASDEDEGQTAVPSRELDQITQSWDDATAISEQEADALLAWMRKFLYLIDANDQGQEQRYEQLEQSLRVTHQTNQVLATLRGRLPLFVLFSNYFRVKPSLHLGHLAKRIAESLLDDDAYDYGNKCLLQLLGFTAWELSDLGRVNEPDPSDTDALQRYKDQLDQRSYQLNAASVRLTEEIRRVWSPTPDRAEADKLQVRADAQYLKVVVEDDLGVEVELDQRSEGFQWLVSFFVVFFAEAQDKHENAILLLDEPGLSLHGLKQREFRTTVSRLAEKNQVLYTTHSPFLVGPDELDRVRVVEMSDRGVGTTVHTAITAGDSAALLPLQEALGYDLAQSLFTQQRNLVLEGLTDYWYIEAVAQLLREAKLADLDERISLIPAGSAGKVVYYATILHAQKLKVAALLDSDAAGDQAAEQDELVHTLGNKAILRTRDVYQGVVKTPEIEDLLRETLISVAKTELSCDVESDAQTQATRPIVDIFKAKDKRFSKYRLAKAFLRWARNAEAKDLSPSEQQQWIKLIGMINKPLK